MRRKSKERLEKMSIFLVLILIIVFFYILNKEWSMIQMKRGNENPITWQVENESGSTNYIEDDILVIDIDDQSFDQLGITITDIFYLPNLEEIHLGLWYDLKKYKGDFTHHVFHLELEDEDNDRYDKNSYSRGESKNYFC